MSPLSRDAAGAVHPVRRGPTRGAIAAGHPRTAAAARIALEAGGNAFDAVVAAAWTACVTEPVLASPGGGGFMVARPADGPPLVYDFIVRTPLAKRPTEDIEFEPVVVDFGTTTQRFQVGLGAAATPGTVAGLFAIHRAHGTLPMATLAEPAVRWAREGVEINPLQAYLLEITGPIYTFTDDTERIYGSRRSAGVPVLAGERLQVPELASTIEALAAEGPDLFYRGELAGRLSAFCANQGGHLTRQDLEAYQARARRPLQLQYRDAELLLNPPPSSGGTLIAFGLALLESVAIGGTDPSSPELLALLAQVMESTNLARARCLDGREHQPEIHRSFLEAAHLAPYLRELAQGYPQSRGTTHMSIVDAQGNAASMTLSNGEGCGRIVPGTGVMLNNMLGEEDVHPQGFHQWPTGTRISSMMAPAVARRGPFIVATGSGGSNRIRTCVLQVLVKLLDLELPVEDAVNLPRIHMEDGLLSIEGGFPPETVRALRERFEQTQVWTERNLFFGGAHTVRYDRQRDRFSGAGDVRRGGVVVVVD